MHFGSVYFYVITLQDAVLVGTVLSVFVGRGAGCSANNFPLEVVKMYFPWELVTHVHIYMGNNVPWEVTSSAMLLGIFTLGYSLSHSQLF